MSSQKLLRERMERARLTSRVQAFERESTRTPAKASAYVKHLPTLPRSKVVLLVRVSGRTQKWRQNHESNKAHLAREVSMLGHKIVGWVMFVAKGSVPDSAALELASNLALMHGGILVARDASRFQRASTFDPITNFNEIPSKEEWQQFIELTQHVTLATLWPPDESLAQTKAREALAGFARKGSKPGRPRKSKRGDKLKWRRRLFPVVIELYNKGLSYREIAKQTGVNFGTVGEWIRKWKSKRVRN